MFSSEIIPFDWLVLTSLPALQLTKLHQLAMQHIPFTSLGQSNPTFPGMYPKIPGDVFLSLCHSVHFSTSLSWLVFLYFLFYFCFPNLFFLAPPPLSVLRYNIISTLRKGKANSCHLKAINVIRLDVFHMYLSLAEGISHDSGDFLLIGMSWALIALWRLCDVSVWSGLLLWNSMCTSTTPLAWSVHQSACHLDPFHTTTHILQQAHTLQQANHYYC